MLEKYDQFYQWWIHPVLKQDLLKEHICRLIFNSNIIAMVAFTMVFSLFSLLNYDYGVIAAIFGFATSILSMLVIRYTTKLDAGFLLISFLFTVVIFIAGYGVGGITSVFLILYPLYIWVNFAYKLSLGISYTAILIVWLTFWTIAEYNGFEYPNTFPSEYLEVFESSYLIFLLCVFCVTFWAANVNEKRLLNNLEQSKQLLVKNERMASLGQLTAGIAHEINNPINFINGNAEALRVDFEEVRMLVEKVNQLQEDPSSAESVTEMIALAQKIDSPYLLQEINGLVEGIQRGGERVSDIVKGLRIFTHQTEGDFRQNDINELIESGLVILSSKIKDKELQITKDLQELPKISCQAGKLNQVFVNILDNAIEAVSVSGLLEVSSSYRENRIDIEISDNGKGMDETTRRHIFDPFFTTKQVGRGTGLGMSISYGIIKEHNGTIEVQSDLGKGTVVKICLPLT